mmetsp:Transcript_35622/g.40036  ORF Transcript_35622/g.40036 Transcript_35622/m.40036 type:complete len:228 (-) Transcript_35622:1278-1961(-)
MMIMVAQCHRYHSMVLQLLFLVIFAVIDTNGFVVCNNNYLAVSPHRQRCFVRASTNILLFASVGGSDNSKQGKNKQGRWRNSNQPYGEADGNEQFRSPDASTPHRTDDETNGVPTNNSINANQLLNQLAAFLSTRSKVVRPKQQQYQDKVRGSSLLSSSNSKNSLRRRIQTQANLRRAQKCSVQSVHRLELSHKNQQVQAQHRRRERRPQQKRRKHQNANHHRRQLY